MERLETTIADLKPALVWGAGIGLMMKSSYDALSLGESDFPCIRFLASVVYCGCGKWDGDHLSLSAFSLVYTVRGLCGEAPSDYPELAEFLVKEGIDFMSLNPDSVMKITLKVCRWM